MICLECRRAGSLLSGVLRVLAEMGPTDVAYVYGMMDIRNAYARCRGGTWCDCQRIVAPGQINWILIEQQKTLARMQEEAGAE